MRLTANFNSIIVDKEVLQRNVMTDPNNSNSILQYVYNYEQWQKVWPLWIKWYEYRERIQDAKIGAGLSVSVTCTYFPHHVIGYTETHVFGALAKCCDKWLSLSCPSVYLSVCLSIYPHRTSRLPQDGFSYFKLEIFKVYQIQIWLKADESNRHFIGKSA